MFAHVHPDLPSCRATFLTPHKATMRSEKSLTVRVRSTFTHLSRRMHQSGPMVLCEPRQGRGQCEDRGSGHDRGRSVRLRRSLLSTCSAPLATIIGLTAVLVQSIAFATPHAPDALATAGLGDSVNAALAAEQPTDRGAPTAITLVNVGLAGYQDRTLHADSEAATTSSPASADLNDEGTENRQHSTVDTPFVDRGQITAVTCYEGWASITRIATFDGVPVSRDVVVRITDLPVGSDPGSFQTFSQPGTEIRGITTEVVEDWATFNTARVAIDAEVKAITARQAEITRRLGVLEKQESFFDALAQRTADSAAQSLSENQLNLERLQEFAAFLAEQHAIVLDERTALQNEQADLVDRLNAQQAQLDDLRVMGPDRRRDVLVTLRATRLSSGEPVEVELRYLAAGVRWQPAYKLRVERDIPSALLEFDVIIEQQTGEDWTDAQVMVSTAPVVRPLDQLTLELWPLEAGDDAFHSSAPLRPDPGETGSLDTVALDRIVERGKIRD
ncbi:MAG: DUF4139 domain-containing protein, partial [Planctomycetota bacterium]